MRYYQEISLLPDAEIPLNFIWEKVFDYIHLALVDSNVEDNKSKIGISFPNYNSQKFSLGTKLRLFAENEQQLKEMENEKWLNRLRDYVHIKSIAPIPQTVNGHAIFKYIRTKPCKGFKARRWAKRHGGTVEEALERYADYQPTQLKGPYIQVRSHSSGNRFPMFIGKEEKGQAQKGLYSSYGLGKTATVPLF